MMSNKKMRAAAKKPSRSINPFDELAMSDDLKRIGELFSNLHLSPIPPNIRRFSTGGCIPCRNSALQMNFSDIEKRMAAAFGKKQKVHPLKDREWAFNVSHPDMFCPEEVAKNVTRTNPLAFARFKDHVVGFIHDSVLAKAGLLKKGFPIKVEFEEFDSVNLFPLDACEIAPVIAWVRDVKEAEWEELGDVTEINVFFPII